LRGGWSGWSGGWGRGRGKRSVRGFKVFEEHGAEDQGEGGLGPAAILGPEAEEVDASFAVAGADPGDAVFDDFGVADPAGEEDAGGGVEEEGFQFFFLFATGVFAFFVGHFTKGAGAGEVEGEGVGQPGGEGVGEGNGAEDAAGAGEVVGFFASGGVDEGELEEVDGPLAGGTESDEGAASADEFFDGGGSFGGETAGVFLGYGALRSASVKLVAADAGDDEDIEEVFD